MPNIILSDRQSAEIIAYILRLKSRIRVLQMSNKPSV
jgi:hypothetical protein